jgi:hypothetical protein
LHYQTNQDNTKDAMEDDNTENGAGSDDDFHSEDMKSNTSAEQDDTGDASPKSEEQEGPAKRAGSGQA